MGGMAVTASYGMNHMNMRQELAFRCSWMDKVCVGDRTGLCAVPACRDSLSAGDAVSDLDT
jgi:hypothetical protein